VHFSLVVRVEVVLTSMMTGVLVRVPLKMLVIAAALV
jgi:hypothetical protein